MKGVLTHFLSVQSHANGTFDAFVYILCIDKLLEEYEKRFKDSEWSSQPFITNLFQKREVGEGAEIISYVLNENVSELELEIINLQTDLSLKTRLNNTTFGI